MLWCVEVLGPTAFDVEVLEPTAFDVEVLKPKEFDVEGVHPAPPKLDPSNPPKDEIGDVVIRVFSKLALEFEMDLDPKAHHK